MSNEITIGDFVYITSGQYEGYKGEVIAESITRGGCPTLTIDVGNGIYVSMLRGRAEVLQ